MQVSIMNPFTQEITTLKVDVQEKADSSVGCWSNQGYSVLEFIEGEVDTYMFLQYFSKALDKMYEEEDTVEDEITNHYLQDCLDTFFDEYTYYGEEPEYEDDYVTVKRENHTGFEGYEDLYGESVMN